VCRRAPERPLGQASVSSLAIHGHGSPWTNTASGPRVVGRVYHDFPLKNKSTPGKIPTILQIAPAFFQN
jgi:hypothetical protein